MQSFENFTITAGNRFAHAAALAVAEAPAKAFNPVLVTGMPQTGKTHLLHAIETYSHRLWPAIVVHHVTAADILCDTKILDTDCHTLLVDDAHLLVSKQQYVAMVITRRLANNKQTFLAARSTRRIPDIKRAVAASAWGLILDIVHDPTSRP